jgi:vacuolar-type H+-ATPase subunit H
LVILTRHPPSITVILIPAAKKEKERKKKAAKEDEGKVQRHKNTREAGKKSKHILSKKRKQTKN